MNGQAEIKAISMDNTKSHCERLFKEEIIRLSVENSVNIIWIPSHIETEENEKAEELTRSGPRKQCP